jgi:outer membrane protein insertion porin family
MSMGTPRRAACCRTPPARAPLLALLVIGLLALLPRAARADEEVWTEEQPEDTSRYSLHRVRFELPLEEPDEGELRGVIESAPSGLLRFRAVDIDKLQADEGRLRLHFRRLGYWNAEVELVLRFERSRRWAEAEFRIEPGVRRMVGSISVQGERSFPEEEILGWTEQRPGEPFDVYLTARDRSTIENTYANRGFYLVKVVADIQEAAVERVPRIHDLVYRIEEGPRFLVGNIALQGNLLTKDEIIRRELVFESGGVLNRELLDRSRNRLYGTGYFSRVDIQPVNVETASGVVDVLVSVRERNMRFVGLGVGYGTRDQLRLSGEWGHRNLWGRGKRASLRAILASELFPVDLIRARVEGRLVEPWLFSTRNQGSVTVSFERRREFFNQGRDEYDLGLVSLILNLSRELTRDTIAYVGLENEWADIDSEPGVEPPDDSKPDITRSASLTLDRDRRDQFFDPTEGFRNRIISSISGGLLGGDNDFWRLQLESSWFRTPFATFAGRIRVGYERPYGQSDIVPDRERFKLGGAASVRGYRYQDIGPGDFMLLANVEMRFPLFWIFRGGLFMDGGNAWPDIDDVRWEDFRLRGRKEDRDRAAETEFRYTVGAGLRVSTPVGPIRLDAGRKLKLIDPDEDRWGYVLSLGHVF